MGGGADAAKIRGGIAYQTIGKALPGVMGGAFVGILSRLRKWEEESKAVGGGPSILAMQVSGNKMASS